MKGRTGAGRTVHVRTLQSKNNNTRIKLCRQYTRVKLFRGQVRRRQGPRGQMPRGLSSVRLAPLKRLATSSVARPGRELEDRLLREAVEQAVAAGGDEVGLAAAARHVRRHPGLLVDGVGDAFAIDVTEHGAAEGAAAPVVAGQVEVTRERFSVQVGAGQHVVHVWRVTAHLHQLALLVVGVGANDLVVVAVQIGNAGGDHGALGVLPRAVADAITRVDGAALSGGIRAQIGAPGLAARARRLGKLLAVRISARKPAKVGALARAGAGDEEGHIVLRLSASG